MGRVSIGTPEARRRLGALIRERRLGHRWTQGELARRADVDVKTLVTCEMGRTASPNTLLRISVAFGLKADALEIWLAKASEISDGEGADLQLVGGDVGVEDRAVNAGGDAVLSVERAALHLGAAASALGG